MSKTGLLEFEKIVEYSWNEKNMCYVIRFLNGSSYTLKISDLPQKLQAKKVNWASAQISKNGSSLFVKAGKKLKVIPSHVIHSKGRLI